MYKIDFGFINIVCFIYLFVSILEIKWFISYGLFEFSVD